MDLNDIRKLIDWERYDAAMEALDRAIEHNPGDATLWYERGRLYWRLGNKGCAISDYEEAAHLDPASPAVQALDLSRDIMDFYNTDLYNP